MGSLIVLVVLVALVALLAKSFAGLWSGGASTSNSYKSKPLLSANEKEFFGRLMDALPEYRVLTQVALGALLQPNVRNDNKQYYRTRASFSQKIADYVVCNMQMEVVAVIELDDRTHKGDRDAKRDAMLEQAGYKVIRWQSKKKPTAAEIRERFGLPNAVVKPAPTV